MLGSRPEVIPMALGIGFQKQPTARLPNMEGHMFCAGAGLGRPSAPSGEGKCLDQFCSISPNVSSRPGRKRRIENHPHWQQRTPGLEPPLAGTLSGQEGGDPKAGIFSSPRRNVFHQGYGREMNTLRSQSWVWSPTLPSKYGENRGGVCSGIVILLPPVQRVESRF